MPSDFTDGVKGITGRVPVSARLQIGRKVAGKPAPIEKDRFHLMTYTRVTDQNRGMREHHPDFRTFNGAQPHNRRGISLVLTSQTWGDEHSGAIRQGLTAYKLPGLNPPMRLPACKGNGERAERWSNDEGRYVNIPCPFDRCQFRQSNGKTPVPCKTMTRLLGRLDWPEGVRMPSSVVLFESGSWHTYRNFRGVREAIEGAARAFGVDPASIPPWGLRIRLNVVEQTSPTAKTRFPVVRVSMVDAAEDHVRRVLESKGQILALAAEQQPVLAIDEAASHYTITGPVGSGDAR